MSRTTFYASEETPDFASLCEMARDNMQAAKSWYDNASEEIRVVCKMEGWSVEKFTAILSVTSPRCAVRRNVRITLQYMASETLLDNVFKSVRRSVEIYNDSLEIRGPKTSAFYAALMGDENAVVLDTHMAGLFAVEQKTAFRRKPDLAHWTRVVRRVAAAIGETPRDTQAALWYARKYAIGEYPEGFPIAAEYKNWLKHNREFPASGVIASDDSDDDSFDVDSF